MDETPATRKHQTYNIVLLGLLAAGLVIAHFISSSRYTGPLRAGRDIVAEIKRKGISSFLDSMGRKSFFLIKNARGQTTGFTMDVFIEAAPDARLNIQSTGLLYIRGRYGREQLMSFQSDESFTEFAWKSEYAAPRQKGGTELVLEKSGVLTVIESGKSPEKVSYKPGFSSIPEYLLDLVLTQMLDSARRKIIVETINADGRTVEAIVSRTDDSGPPEDKQQYEFLVNFLDGRRASQRVYLDSRKRISKILLKEDGIYLFERTTMENVLLEVPEAARYIPQEHKILGPNQPQY
ncbi:MAG TPA: hypothetical protein VMW16_13360 [Sedimentisphaerales bacterium]|nr:hypothetical protein [Sedimentisphaerales bacterium]